MKTTDDKRILAAIQPDPEPMPEAAEGVAAMNACLVQLDMLVAESGRGVDWGEEDAFRMGEWFEDADLANIERAKRFVTGLFRATPSSAGMVSVEAAAKVLMAAQEAYFDGEGGSDALGSLDTEALRALAGEDERNSS